MIQLNGTNNLNNLRDKLLTIKRYSKSSKFYKDIKSDFFISNEKNLKNVIKINKDYISQIKRRFCKLCGEKLNNKEDFSKHFVKYVFCNKCDHLNGFNKDTKKFTGTLYTSKNGKNYSQNYLDSKYEERIKNIYLPKVKFLIDHIPSKNLNLYDYGCGLGHFVDASLRLGLKAIGGDVNKTLVDEGNQIILKKHGRKNIINLLKPDIFCNDIKNTDIISLLGVIEHIQNLKSFLKNLNKTKCKYIYYAVPTYGFSVIIESIFENIFPRQLGGGHTHLFTEKSIEKLNELIGIKPVAEWRFGTDIMDLKRSIEVTLKSKRFSNFFQNRFDKNFTLYGDKLQKILDRSHDCSQIHVIGKKVS